MKNLFNLIALILGFSQSYSTENKSNHHYYYNGKEITETEFMELENAQYSPRTQTPISKLSKREFVKYMATKNIICL
jgi:hypothetical protein